MANLTPTASFYSPEVKFFAGDELSREAIVILVISSIQKDGFSDAALFVYERRTGAPLFAHLFSTHWELFVCDCCMEVQWSMDPDDEVFYGLDFETETDLGFFIQAFDDAKTQAAASTKVEGSILSKSLDHAEALDLLAKTSREIFSESSKIADIDTSPSISTVTQWILDAWRSLW